jgi:carbonic anhydrase/acetyltransferase-like protein (isoleucine patch superfamily)
MILPYRDRMPVIHPSAFVAPGADVIGRVRLAKTASVWFGCVLRGDVNRIDIGEATNIQDGSILHVDDRFPCRIADHVHVGHHANLHGCVVERGAMIGIGAIVLTGARAGAGAIIGAGSVVLERTVIPPRTLAVGVPAKVVRAVTATDLAYIQRWVRTYVRLAQTYRLECTKRLHLPERLAQQSRLTSADVAVLDAGINAALARRYRPRASRRGAG